MATTQQQIGTSLGTALLNTLAVSATTHYLIANAAATLHGGTPSSHLAELALVHGYTIAFWWTTGIFVAGAIICDAALRRGPLAHNDAPTQNNPRQLSTAAASKLGSS